MKLMSKALTIALITYSVVGNSNNLCITTYSTKVESIDYENTVDKLKNFLELNKKSNTSFVITKFFQENFSELDRRYDSILARISSRGSNSKLASAIDSTQVLLATMNEKALALSKELERKKPSESDINSLSRLLQQCYLKIDICKSTLSSSMEEVNNYIIEANSLVKTLQQFENVLSNLSYKMNQIVLEKSEEATSKVIVESKRQTLAIQIALLGKFIEAENKKIQNALMQLHTIPEVEQMILNLDASGAPIGALKYRMEKLNSTEEQEASRVRTPGKKLIDLYSADIVNLSNSERINLAAKILGDSNAKLQKIDYLDTIKLITSVFETGEGIFGNEVNYTDVSIVKKSKWKHSIEIPLFVFNFERNISSERLVLPSKLELKVATFFKLLLLTNLDYASDSTEKIDIIFNHLKLELENEKKKISARIPWYSLGSQESKDKKIISDLIESLPYAKESFMGYIHKMLRWSDGHSSVSFLGRSGSGVNSGYWISLKSE